MAFDVYVCIHPGSVVLVSSDKPLLEVHAATLPARARAPRTHTAAKTGTEVRLGASNAAKALLEALELERSGDNAGGAARDELRSTSSTKPSKIEKYGDRFKATAVKLSSLLGVQVKDVAVALDIHPFMLSLWRPSKLDVETTAELRRLRGA
jgi:transposase